MSHSEIQGENACVVDMHNVSSPRSGSMLASLVRSDRVASLGQRQADRLLSLKLKNRNHSHSAWIQHNLHNGRRLWMVSAAGG